MTKRAEGWDVVQEDVTLPACQVLPMLTEYFSGQPRRETAELDARQTPRQSSEGQAGRWEEGCTCSMSGVIPTSLETAVIALELGKLTLGGTPCTTPSGRVGKVLEEATGRGSRSPAHLQGRTAELPARTLGTGHWFLLWPLLL